MGRRKKLWWEIFDEKSSAISNNDLPKPSINRAKEGFKISVGILAVALPLLALPILPFAAPILLGIGAAGIAAGLVFFLQKKIKTKKKNRFPFFFFF